MCSSDLIEMVFTRTGIELKVPSALKHAYALSVVGIGWVLFRADSLSAGLRYLGNMVGVGVSSFADSYSIFMLKSSLGVFLIGILFCFPVTKKMEKQLQKSRVIGFIAGNILIPLVYVVLLLVCISYMQISSYNPFLYNNF